MPLGPLFVDSRALWAQSRSQGVHRPCPGARPKDGRARWQARGATDDAQYATEAARLRVASSAFSHPSPTLSCECHDMDASVSPIDVRIRPWERLVHAGHPPI